MRTLAALFVTAAALAISPAGAMAWPPTCQAEPCTDPVGHFTKPVQPLIENLIEPA